MDDVRRQFETNVFGLVRMCQLVLPGMRDQGRGRIVNISSMGANFTFPGGGVYHATKYAVEAISDALRFEVKAFGVDVVVIQPGLIRTEFGGHRGQSRSATENGPYAEFNAEVARATEEVYEKGPLARFGGGPEKVAETIERAITAESPKIRYRVTPSAHMLVGQRRLMSAGHVGPLPRHAVQAPRARLTPAPAPPRVDIRGPGSEHAPESPWPGGPPPRWTSNSNATATTSLDAARDGEIVFFLGAGVNLCGRPQGRGWTPGGKYLPTGQELADYLAERFRPPVERPRTLPAWPST